jgi:hypothetical protein|nr:MAG TPA: hypothetical protein [Caudoviricetes sp.]
MDDAKLFAMMQEFTEKFDTMIDLLGKIESNTSSTDSNTGDIYYVKSELEDANTNLRKVINKMD